MCTRFFRAVLSVAVIITVTTVKAQPTTSSQTEAKAKKSSSEKITTAALIAGKVPGVRFKYNVPYLESGRAEKLDLYQPAKLEPGRKYPAVVIIHGGGWVGGAKDARRELGTGTTLARNGYVAVSAEYMKEAGKRWPANLHDCKNAVRWLRANADELQVDPDNIGVIGGSAGGHLALMVAYTAGIDELEPKAPYPGISSKVNACIDLYGITNVLTRQRTTKDGKPTGEYRDKTALFSETPDEDKKKWELASPVSHVKKDSPPTLILHGGRDTTVDRDQAYELARRLDQVGAEHELKIFHEAGHSFSILDKDVHKDLPGIVLEFFDKHLKREQD